MRRRWALAYEALRAAGLKALPRIRADRSVSVRFANDSSARLTETAVTLENLGRDNGALARRFASACARLARWIDLGAVTAWPFGRLPEVGEPLACDPETLPAAIVARMKALKFLTLGSSPAIRATVESLLAKAYGPDAREALTSEPNGGGGVLLLTPECVRALNQRPLDGLGRLEALMQDHGDLIVLALKPDRAPQPVRLIRLIEAVEKKVAQQSVLEARQPAPAPPMAQTRSWAGNVAKDDVPPEPPGALEEGSDEDLLDTLEQDDNDDMSP